MLTEKVCPTLTMCPCPNWMIRLQAGLAICQIFLRNSTDKSRNGLMKPVRIQPMSGIALSASVRQNLLSLQSTASLLATTRNDQLIFVPSSATWPSLTSPAVSHSLRTCGNSAPSAIKCRLQAGLTICQTAVDDLASRHHERHNQLSQNRSGHVRHSRSVATNTARSHSCAIRGSPSSAGRTAANRAPLT
jgi:hypothetical protein